MVKLAGPWLQALLEGLLWFLKTLWEGFKDVVDNAATIVFCVFIVVASAVWADRRSDNMCHEQIAKIHSDYAKKLKQPVKTIPNKPQRSIVDDIFGVFR